MVALFPFGRFGLNSDILAIDHANNIRAAESAKAETSFFRCSRRQSLCVVPVMKNPLKREIVEDLTL